MVLCTAWGSTDLHSSETTAAHVADDEYLLFDADVTSYYPRIILNLGLAPQHLGEQFLDVYRTIVDRRIEAKRAEQDVTSSWRSLSMEPLAS